MISFASSLSDMKILRSFHICRVARRYTVVIIFRFTNILININYDLQVELIKSINEKIEQFTAFDECHFRAAQLCALEYPDFDGYDSCMSNYWSFTSSTGSRRHSSQQRRRKRPQSQ